jgi:CheY-like chemotaxis protein
MAPPSIIGLSGDLDQQTIDKGIKAGMEKVLHKPMRRDHVLKILKSKGFI